MNFPTSKQLKNMTLEQLKEVTFKATARVEQVRFQGNEPDMEARRDATELYIFASLLHSWTTQLWMISRDEERETGRQKPAGFWADLQLLCQASYTVELAAHRVKKEMFELSFSKK